MRLLNTTTLEFKEFGDELPEYAILSHRWGEGEVTYKDVESGRHRKLQGWSKILNCCKLARSRDLEYAWVDTCCIDKSSSAELTEAINSMYRWYENAAECYAYLNDVELRDLKHGHKEFSRSAWFTRGWTLQELIAPEAVFFYNKQWRYLGSKSELYSLLESITGIDAAVLSGEVKTYDCTVSQRMSWAAQRKTSRIEDRAYSLLGIFDVNMPMLYGEGEKAFRRLQQKIINHSDDHTIFAWTNNKEFAKPVLASSPSCFTNLGTLTRMYPTNDTTQGFTLVNTGLLIQLHLLPWTMNTYLAPLRCAYLEAPTKEPRKMSSRGYSRACLFLQQTEHDNQFVRVSVEGKDSIVVEGDKIAEIRERFNIEQKQILIMQPDNPRPITHSKPAFYGYQFTFRHPQLFATGSTPMPPDALCYHRWRPDEPVMEIETGGQHSVGILRLSGFTTGLYMYLGFDLDFAPLCLVTSRTPRSSKIRRFTLLPPDFTKVSKDEANQMLDLNWLRSQIAEGVQSGETILAFKGDRKGTSQLECKSLSLVLTFERRMSQLENKVAWHIDFDRMRSNSSSNATHSVEEDVTVRSRQSSSFLPSVAHGDGSEVTGQATGRYHSLYAPPQRPPTNNLNDNVARRDSHRPSHQKAPRVVSYIDSDVTIRKPRHNSGFYSSNNRRAFT